MFSHVQYISQGNTPEAQLRNIHLVLSAGYKWIQLRFKDQSAQIIMPLAIQVKRLCDRYGATFIVNDGVHIAKEVNADGVHLGLEDTAIAEARLILGNDKIIGGTANTLQQALSRINDGCNYVGLGPMRFTTTKEKLSPVLGLDGYRQIMNALSHQGKITPVYAIGGIVQADIEPLTALGIHGVAVSGLLTGTALITAKNLQPNT